MEQYITQLLADLEVLILQRWQENPPHYYQAGHHKGNPFLEPPKGWKEEDVPVQLVEDSSGDLYIQEIARMLKGQAVKISMYDHFGLKKEQFPALDKLTDEQVGELSFNILRLWEAFNYTACLPDMTPYEIIYPILLKRMSEPITLSNYGHIGVEFCNYLMENCPFGEEYCMCKDFAKDWEGMEENSTKKEG